MKIMSFLGLGGLGVHSLTQLWVPQRISVGIVTQGPVNSILGVSTVGGIDLTYRLIGFHVLKVSFNFCLGLMGCLTFMRLHAILFRVDISGGCWSWQQKLMIFGCL